MSWSRAVRAADAAVVLILAGWAQIQVWTQPDPGWQGDPVVHAVLVAVIALPLLIRRRYPLVVAIAVTAATWVQFELGSGLAQPFFAVMLALYSVATHAALVPALCGAMAVATAVLAADVARLVRGDPVGEVIPAWFFLAAVWGFGRWIRRRGAETSALREETAALERERDRVARAAVADERARIARELHDLVAHSMGIIVLQAQGAQRVLERDSATAAAALSAIEHTGREGLTEMRRLLGVLRADGERTPLDPPPGMAQLDALVAQVRDAGLDVQLSVDCAAAVPQGVGLAVYRIVQEALTNTLKHAHAPGARVSVRCVPAGLEIEVSDDGRRVPSGTGIGHGIIGMRERAALYGGTVEAGHDEHGGYRVHVSLPFELEPT